MLITFVRTATVSFLPIALLLAFTPAAFTQNRLQPDVALGWFAASNGQILPGTFVAGSEKGRPLYLCRANYGNGTHPGKIVGNYCNISWGGWEVFTPNYEVLTAPRSVRLVWIAASNGRVPPGAMVGGNEKGQSLYVCRAAYQDGLHPGKVIGRNCNIGWGGREALRPNYEVLVLEDS